MTQMLCVMDAICIPLAMIFNIYLNEGKLPNDWNIAHATAIHKKGSKQKAENYIPISLTSICGKI